MVNADLPDVIEIWNNVFIQYNREADGSLRPLPSQHVDTGMGFERLTSILQGVDSNYDTDIFMPLFDTIQKATGARPYSGKVGADDADYVDMAYRVVADHIRTLCFAIADGAVPSNDGRGYVLRRVLRRAVRFGRQNLGAELGFFAQLVPTLVGLMGGTFPELVDKQAHVTAIIRDEEESFSRTIDKGLLKFAALAETVGDDKVFSGADAFFLYDSMGFPVDLTELMAEEKGLTLDKEAFEVAMDAAKKKSSEAHRLKTAGGSGKDMRLVAEQTATLVSKGVGGTKDDAKYIWNQDLEGCTVKALFIGRNETADMIGFVDEITSENSTVGVILDKSSFYAESGGQIYDTGVIKTSSGAEVRVDNVQVYGQFVLHLGEVVSGVLKVGNGVACSVDYVRRSPIASNHTMTHVLNCALRQVLASDSSVTIDQKGSFQDEFKSRFDFSWNGQLTPEQLTEVERLCVERIEKEVPVESFVAALADAEKISALRAVFGEKYPDPVRVVAVSNHSIPEMLANPQDATWNEYSIEFCGGTHLTNTNEAETFCLLSEEGIAKGIRRIIFVTQKDARKAIQTGSDFAAKLEKAKALEGEALDTEVKSLGQELPSLTISAVQKINFRESLAALGKKVAAYRKQKIAGMTDEIAAQMVAAAEATTGNKVVFRFDFGSDNKVVKKLTTAYGKQVKDKAILLMSADEDAGKLLIVGFAPKGVDVDCKAWVAAATEGTGGKGGGKKDSAQFQVAGIGHAESIMTKAKGF
jgi:alanyl-tRNA synthetase